MMRYEAAEYLKPVARGVLTFIDGGAGGTAALVDVPAICHSTIHVSPLLMSFSRLPGPFFVTAASIWATIISS
jgi:hypothetical protein